MTKTVNGHGFFRKSKAYGLVCGIALGLAFLGNANVSAEEVATTVNSTPIEQTVLATTESEATQTVVVPANEDLTNAVSTAQNAGATVTQTQTQTVPTEADGQANYDEQAEALAKLAEEQNAINAQNAQITSTNNANSQAGDQAKKTAEETNQYVDDVTKKHSDSTVTTQTIDYGQGTASDFKKGSQIAKDIDLSNQKAVKTHEAEEQARAQALSNQAQIDKENHEKWVKFLNDNYVRNLTGITNDVVKTDNIKSLTSTNPDSVVTKQGDVTNISTQLSAGQSVTHIFEFIKPIMLFQALEIGKLEETINLISSQNASGTTAVVQRSATGGGVQYNTTLPNSSVLEDGFTNYTRIIKYYTVDGKLVTPDLLLEAINKTNGVFGLSKKVSTITKDEFNYDTIKNSDTTNSKVTLRYFTGKGDARVVSSSKTFDTTAEALAYLKANPAQADGTGTSILQEGSTFDETNHQYYAIRNSQISFEFLKYLNAKADTPEDNRSGQGFSMGGGFSSVNTDFKPADNIVIPTVTTLKLVKVTGEIKPAITPLKDPATGSWHLNQYKHNLTTVKDVTDLDGNSIDNGKMKIGDKGVYTLLGSKILANGKDTLVKYDFEDTLDVKHDKYLDYKVYAFTPIKLKDGTVLQSMDDLKSFASQVYDEATGRFYVTLNSDFLAKIAKDSDFQAKIEILFERISAGEVTNVFTNHITFKDDKTGEEVDIPVPSNPVKTITLEEPKPTTPPKKDQPKPKEPKPELPKEEPKQQAVLPSTGEATSILSIFGGLNLLGIAGYLGRKKKD